MANNGCISVIGFLLEGKCKIHGSHFDLIPRETVTIKVYELRKNLNLLRENK